MPYYTTYTNYTHYTIYTSYTTYTTRGHKTMGKVTSITNRKGGTAKTATAGALGAGLSIRGYKTLCIDMDSQANLTFDMGASSEGLSVMDVLKGTATAEEAIQHTDRGDIIPGSAELATADLYTEEWGAYRLRNAIDPIREQYDFIVIDCPPSLGVLTVNALTASDSAVITAQAEVHSLQAIGQLNETIKAVRQNTNPNLQIEGILITRYNGRAILSRDMKQNLQEAARLLNTKVFAQPIRECTAIKEAQAMQQDIFTYSKRSNASTDYSAFVEEYIGVSEETSEAIRKALGC